MRNTGLRFDIPNAYGNYLFDIIQTLPLDDYIWLVDNDEIHLLNGNEFTNQFLFGDDERILTGEFLYNRAKNNRYYLVFVSLNAFSKGGEIKRVKNYKEFSESDCQIILIVYDCSFVILLSKDGKTISNMYDYALSKNYKNVSYIPEDDLIANIYNLE